MWQDETKQTGGRVGRELREMRAEVYTAKCEDGN